MEKKEKAIKQSVFFTVRILHSPLVQESTIEEISGTTIGGKD